MKTLALILSMMTTAPVMAANPMTTCTYKESGMDITYVARVAFAGAMRVSVSSSIITDGVEYPTCASIRPFTVSPDPRGQVLTGVLQCQGQQAPRTETFVYHPENQTLEFGPHLMNCR